MIDCQHNPIKKSVFIVFSIHFLINLLSLFIFVYTGEYFLEGEYYALLNINTAIIAIAAMTISFLFINISFFTSRKKVTQFYINESKYSQFILIIQILYVCLSFYYGINIAGKTGRGDMPALLSWFFVIFNPDILFTIYLFLVKPSRIKTINIIVYMLSMFARGWMAGFMIIVVYSIIFHKISIKRVIFILLISILLSLLLPYIINIKWYVRSNFSSDGFDVISMLTLRKNYTMELYEAMSYVIFRIQHISSVIHVINNIDKINPTEYLPFWLEGNLQLILRRLFSLDMPTFSHYVVTHILGPSWATWNIHTGVSSWLVIKPFDLSLYIYIYITIFFISKIKIVNYSYTFQAFVYYMIFSRVYVGWFNAYINFIIALLVTYFIIKAISLLSREKS